MENESPHLATVRREHEHEHEHEHEAVAQARQRLEVQRNLHGEHHSDYATGLNHLALLLIMHNAPDEAEPLLHQALAIRKEVLGEDHPDYATCLSSLGGLLWARGDLEGAEPLLHQAHDIRCRVLGSDHVRSLASQSCLEQFLRMKSEQRDQGQYSETIHVSAAAIDMESVADPTEALAPAQPITPAFEPAVPCSAPPPAIAAGEWAPPGAWEPEPESDSHPEWAASASASAPIPGEELETKAERAIEEHARLAQEEVGSHSMSTSISDLSHELVVLTDVFTDLSERLMEAALQLQTPGLPPPDALVAELSSCQREFDSLSDRTLALSQSLNIECPSVENLTNLEDLTALLDAIAESGLRQASFEEVQRRALSVLDRVLRLSREAGAGFATLDACQDQARALQGAIADATWNTLPAEAEPLAEGHHALAQLLTLVEDGDELSDDHWVELHDSVAAAFGKSLATAAGRGRLLLPPERADAPSEE